jgi:hypothetical protein
MPRPIGYYVHHHGDGHRQRALSIAAAMGGRIVLLGTGLAGRTGTVRTIDLPDDRLTEAGFDGEDGEGCRPRALHYAPIDHDGVRRRVAIITDWIARERPALIVVDVSVEIAMLARLAATPTVYVRLAGWRDDPAHLDAFRGARALLAPFAPDLDDSRTAGWVRAKTMFVPGIGPVPAAGVEDGDNVLVVLGAGGSAIDGERFADAARATPDRRWRVAGSATAPADAPSNLTMLGWIDDVGSEIRRAGVVVGAAGDGVVGAILSAEKPFVCLPEPRPFDEQTAKARQLATFGAAVVRERWPAGDEWRDVLAEAGRLDRQAAARLNDGDGANRAAAFLLAAAEQWP